jgi:uncharacterized protein (TIGR03084 family)
MIRSWSRLWKVRDPVAAPTAGSEVFDDLEAEDERLEAILAALGQNDWAASSAAPGWKVVDVVVHLAQTDEAVVRTTAGERLTRLWGQATVGSLDAAMDQAVREESAPPALAFERWRRARRAALLALRRADPSREVDWAARPLKPRVLATTRLAEHWTHGLDITGPLQISFPDCERLRHVAWLAHRSLPYAWSLVGRPARDVFCELSGPSGETWTYGPHDAASAICGPAGEFCRVAAQRLSPEATQLTVRGPHGREALAVLRTYAA